jgi:hypothetical protein
MQSRILFVSPPAKVKPASHNGPRHTRDKNSRILKRHKTVKQQVNRSLQCCHVSLYNGLLNRKLLLMYFEFREPA